jgi:hypothetical protein
MEGEFLMSRVLGTPSSSSGYIKPYSRYSRGYALLMVTQGKRVAIFLFERIEIIDEIGRIEFHGDIISPV